MLRLFGTARRADKRVLPAKADDGEDTIFSGRHGKMSAMFQFLHGKKRSLPKSGALRLDEMTVKPGDTGKYINGNDICVCCSAYVPEGTSVCAKCLKG